MRNFSDYLQNRAALAEDIEQLSSLLREQGNTAHSNQLNVIRKRLLNDDFRILICGEFKRGKSCLINAMLGGKILPMKVAPCTAVVTEVTYADTPGVTVFPISDKAFDTSIESLGEHISIPKSGRSNIERVQVHYPLELCKNAVTIIDSPGLNEHWERTDISLHQIAQADAVIMVLSCEMALSRSEMEFIQTHLSDRHFGLFFVWNRYDAIREDPEEIAALDARSEAKLGGFKADVSRLSARDALIARQSGNQEKLELSGLVPFMEKIETFLTTKRGQTKLQQPSASFQHMARMALSSLFPRNEMLLKAPLDQLRQQETDARPKLEALEKRRIDASVCIERNTRGLIQKLETALRHYLESAPDKAYLDSQQLEFPSTAGRQERQDRLKAWYDQWLQQSLSNFAETALTPLCNEALENLEMELRGLLKDFQSDLQTVIDLGDAGVDVDRLLKADWFQEIPIFVSTAAALLLIGVSSGAIALSLIGLGALRAWLTGALLGADDRRRIANAFGEALQQNEMEMNRVLKNNIEQLSEQLAERIDAHLLPLIQDAETALTHAINARESGESQVKIQLERLEKSRETTKNFLNKYSEQKDDARDP